MVPRKTSSRSRWAGRCSSSRAGRRSSPRTASRRR
jgi:hypothetical protein